MIGIIESACDNNRCTVDANDVITYFHYRLSGILWLQLLFCVIL
jgi:hypothetical protein